MRGPRRRSRRGSSAPDHPVRGWRLVREQDGQILPILFVALLGTVALGVMLFQVGRATDLKADGQTGADAAALAAAKNISDQVIRNDGSFDAIDDAEVRESAADYAGRNAADVVSVEREGCAVTVRVRTQRTLDGEQARRAGVEGRPAFASARAEMVSFGAFGSVPLDGAVPPAMREAAALAASLGLQVTSTTGGHHAAGSLHYQGLAIDVSNSTGPTPQMAAFYRIAQERFEGRILELFYDPLGGIKNGQEIGAIGGHSNHVHIGMAPGGSTGSGDEGGEDGDEGKGGEDSGDGLDLGGLGGGGAPGARLIPLDQAGGSGCTGALGGIDLSGLGNGNFSPNASSLKIAGAICKVGERYNVSDKVMLAAFETAIVESGVQNLSGGHLDSAGVFQQRPSQGWGSLSQVTDVFYAASQFFARARRNERSGQTAGQLAQSVQRSAYPDKYDQNQANAVALMERVGCRT